MYAAALLTNMNGVGLTTCAAVLSLKRTWLRNTSIIVLNVKFLIQYSQVPIQMGEQFNSICWCAKLLLACKTRLSFLLFSNSVSNYYLLIVSLSRSFLCVGVF
ncbi:hypothetical protein CEXT_236241 [Caerostris extrusa]|uniref:Uncharacterized protein n=1 Tax=Caerostris extrusa TaxID=172846 RepID=A0AAV4TFQ4_CAEEX|nr:hypothetical protein CEXT_236241 [Caerostris extrusa]